jgi:mono/diheme cytochrome c family protein
MLAVACVACVACASATPAGGRSPAESVYNRNCIICHGKTGGGASGPNLLEGDLTRSKIELKTRVGGEAMRAFEGQISEADIHLAADWVIELRRRAGRETPDQ